MYSKISHFIFFSFAISFVVLLLTSISVYFFEAKDAITTEKIKHYEGIIDDFEYTINLNIKEIMTPLTKINDIINSDDDESVKTKQISIILSTTPDIKRVLLIDHKGIITNNYPPNEQLYGIDMSNNEIVKKGRTKQHEIVVLGPHVCIVDKTSHYTIPIQFSNHLFLAYLSMDWIKPFIEKFSKVGLIVFTVDQKGTITTHTRQNLAAESFNIKNIPAVKKALMGERGPFVESFEGKKYLLYARKLELLNWVIFVGEDYNTAYYLIQYIKNRGIVILIASILTCLLLSLLISRLLQKPINSLLNEINNIKKGNYDINLFDKGFEEIKSISESLYSMAEEIKDREHRFRKIFEDSKNPIILTLNDGTIIDLNHATIELYGFSSKDKVIGKNIINLFSSHDEFKNIMQNIKGKGFISNHELNFFKENKETFPALLSCSTLRYSGVKDEIYMHLIIDLTERKKLLEQLLHAQKMESVGRLTGGIAHDFNNLLTIVYGHAQLMEIKHKDNPIIMKHINSIKKAVERGKDFVKNLLAFSRKQILDMKVYDINEVIKEENKLLTSCIREDIKIETHLIDKPCPVSIDKSQFTQILLNLTVNAVDAMPNGGSIKIETNIKNIDDYYLKFEQKAKEGEFVVLSFSDTGMGIPQDVVTKIFDPFFTTKEKGTGLGLSVIHGIVSQHGGFLNVYSEVGKGTTFRIYLPIALQELSETIQYEVTEIDIRGKQAFIIEDNPELLEVTKEMLTNLGLTVFAFSDGYEALETFKNIGNSIDICFIDVIMPNINGFNLFENLKEINPNIKALFLTGYTDNVVHVNFILKQGVHIISKPFSRKDLIVKIKEVLSN